MDTKQFIEAIERAGFVKTGRTHKVIKRDALINGGVTTITEEWNLPEPNTSLWVGTKTKWCVNKPDDATMFVGFTKAGQEPDLMEPIPAENCQIIADLWPAKP